ncbi:hypothetical protein TNCV_3558981 [Trichonephila clavipes]|uniref:Uncharacterized protein n=1 Tax=Trichonephila clavipes TaxID=2585209 RepID=A0A8X6WCM0_TRICX|nr:hypothetical protein TNCV_3558981 [Trichonephila clavipes]
MDSWLRCQGFKSSTAEDPPCKEDRCTLHTSKLKRPPFGVLWKLATRHDCLPKDLSRFGILESPNGSNCGDDVILNAQHIRTCPTLSSNSISRRKSNTLNTGFSSNIHKITSQKVFIPSTARRHNYWCLKYTYTKDYSQAFTRSTAEKNPEGPEIVKSGHQHDHQDTKLGSNSSWSLKMTPIWLYHQVSTESPLKRKGGIDCEY